MHQLVFFFGAADFAIVAGGLQAFLVLQVLQIANHRLISQTGTLNDLFGQKRPGKFLATGAHNFQCATVDPFIARIALLLLPDVDMHPDSRCQVGDLDRLIGKVIGAGFEKQIGDFLPFINSQYNDWHCAVLAANMSNRR